MDAGFTKAERFAKAAGFAKTERLCCVTAISTLVSKGKYIVSGPLKCCFLKRDDGTDSFGTDAVGAGVVDSVTDAAGAGVGAVNRIVISVPKRHFKRAVKRNLLKRRIREAYRLQKGILPAAGIDLMFAFNSKEVAAFDDIYAAVGELLQRIAKAGLR